jgi:hypothetical protein
VVQGQRKVHVSLSQKLPQKSRIRTLHDQADGFTTVVSAPRCPGPCVSQVAVCRPALRPQGDWRVDDVPKSHRPAAPAASPTTVADAAEPSFALPAVLQAAS